jgi:hypothetical protein
VLETQVAEEEVILIKFLEMKHFIPNNKNSFKKKTMNTDQKVGTYGDTKTGKTFWWRIFKRKSKSK